MAQQTLVPATADVLDGVEALDWPITTYEQKEYTKVRQADGSDKRVATGKLTGKIFTGLKIQPKTAGGHDIGQNIWTPPYSDVCLRLAATFLEAAAMLQNAPVKNGGTAASAGTRTLTVAEFLAQQAAAVNGTVPVAI